MGGKNIQKYETLATIVTVVFIAYYATGLYRNILEIKAIKKIK